VHCGFAVAGARFLCGHNQEKFAPPRKRLPELHGLKAQLRPLSGRAAWISEFTIRFVGEWNRFIPDRRLAAPCEFIARPTTQFALLSSASGAADVLSGVLQHVMSCARFVGEFSEKFF